MPTTPMKRRPPLILGIETSCDDTACAILDGAGRVLSSVVSSQLKTHQPYGGVVPEIASREHLRNWNAVYSQVLDEAGVSLQDIDAFAATRGPGLVGSLLVGLSLGRAMAYALGRAFHAMHHLEGHLFSPFLSTQGEPAAAIPEKFVGLIVSGGHASLLDVDGHQIHSLAETRDDAMGEVFDKVGKRVGLAYPQGPRVDALAENGDPAAYPMKVPRPRETLFFSFSGLKTEALRQIERLERQNIRIRFDGAEPEVPQPILDLLAGFRKAAVDQILDRVRQLHSSRGFQTLAVSGGAAANRLLRRDLSTWAETAGVDLRLVPLKFSGDNAAMIAFAALQRQLRGQIDDPREAVVASRIPFQAAS